MLTKTGRDIPIQEVTKDDYIVPAGEEHVYHVRIEVKKFNAETGERQSKPRIQKFGVKMYKTSVEKNLKKQSFTLDVMHDPTEWLAKQEAAQKAARQQAAANKVLAAQQKAQKDAEQAAADKAAEKAAMKAEIMAELKAAGVIPAKGKKDANDTKGTEGNK